MRSLSWRLALAFFLVVAVSLGLVAYLTQKALTSEFWLYLSTGPMGPMMHGMGPGMGRMMWEMMGIPERRFLDSVYRSIWWAVGIGGGTGVLVSLLLTRSIARPLHELTTTVLAIRRGELGRQARVERQDEIGTLAASVNAMSRALAENDEQRRRLLAGVAHELRTPLAIIQGNLEGMLDGVVEPGREQLASLYEESRRLNKLITDLRDLSLAEAGQMRLETAPCDALEALKAAADAFRPAAVAKGVSLEVDGPGNVPPVLADPDRLRQVLANLLENAVRYTPAGGRITIAARALEGEPQVKFAVHDTGGGIPAADLPHVFDHFYRADASRARASGGSGLGLAIVRQLVEAQGGRVWVESREGEGSSFFFTLPVAARQDNTEFARAGRN